MKLSPLGGGERTEDGMIEEVAARSKSFFAAANDVIHLSELRAYLGPYFFGWDSAWTSDGWGFSAGGQVAKSYDDEGSDSLCPGLSSGERLAGFGDAIESFDGTRIG